MHIIILQKVLLYVHFTWYLLKINLNPFVIAAILKLVLCHFILLTVVMVPFIEIAKRVSSSHHNVILSDAVSHPHFNTIYAYH